jgi:hypothetical protein
VELLEPVILKKVPEAAALAVLGSDWQVSVARRVQPASFQVCPSPALP